MDSIMNIKMEIANEVNDKLISSGVISEESSEIKQWNKDLLIFCGHKRIKQSKLKAIVTIMDSSMSLWQDSMGMYIRVM